VRIVEGTSDALFPRLKEGRLDVLVGRFWPGEEPELLNETLFDSRFALIARAEHPLASRRRLRLADTVALPWILPPPGAHSRGALEAMFLQANLKPPPHGVETSSYLIIRALLVATDMVCPLPIETPQEDVARGLLQLLPLELDVRLPPVGIVRSAQRAPSPATDTLLKYLRAAALEGNASASSAARPRRAQRR
jgi:DNA-binding transcriptional LysR family regulator